MDGNRLHACHGGRYPDLGFTFTMVYDEAIIPRYNDRLHDWNDRGGECSDISDSINGATHSGCRNRFIDAYHL